MNHPYAAKLQELLEASYNLPNAVCDIGRVELGPVELEDITRRIYNRDEKSGIDAKAHYLLASSGFNAELVLKEIAHLQFREHSGDAKSRSGDSGSPADAFQGSSVGLSDSVPAVPLIAKSGLKSSSNGALSGQIGAHGVSPGMVAGRKGSGAKGLPLSGQLLSGQISDRKTSAMAAAHGEVDAVDTAGDDVMLDPIAAQNSREFDDFVEQHVKIDWNARKREVLSLLARKKPRPATLEGLNGFGATSSSGKHSSGGTGTGTGTAGSITPLMGAYASPVVALCDRGFEARDFVAQLSAAASRAPRVDEYVLDAWRALEIQNPRGFLEKQFYEHVNFEIASNRQNARLGGEPSAYGKVKAYVRLKYYRNGQWDSRIGLVNQTPIWAYIYYLVRAGFVDEALKLVLERTDIFSTVGASFATFFKAWAESPSRALSKHYTELVQNEYHQLFRPGRAFDPYHQALCKIIGRCELYRRSLPMVAQTTEDWLWLQLMLCRELGDPVSSTYPGAKYTPDDLKAYVLEIGAGHFASEPTKYFFILGLLGLWDEAIRFLLEGDESAGISGAATGGIAGAHADARDTEAHAVHFAIALSATKSPDFVGDLVSLIKLYTRYFRQNMPGLAVDYLSIISLSPSTAFVDKSLDSARESGTPSQLAAREALRELVLETRRFSELVGDVDVISGKAVNGSIENRMGLVGLNDLRDYRYSIAHRAAETANKQGFTLDAVLLYRLAQNYTHVFELINSHLGLLISSVSIGSKVEDSFDSSTTFLQLAKNVIRIDNSLGDSTSTQLQAHRKTCEHLLAIAECLDLLAQRDFEACLSRIADTGLLVLSPTSALDEVNSLSRDFSSYDESLACNIPRLLLVAMTCIRRINESLRAKDAAPNDLALEQNRGKASNCMVYAGLIQYRMPKEVYLELTQLEDTI